MMRKTGNMVNGNGDIVFSGITDAELIMILQIKEKHEQSLDFNPSQMQPTQVPAAPGNPHGGKKFYNNVRLNWRGDNGLKAVFQVVEGLLAEEKKPQQP
jgi:hypothetical protein